MDKGKFFSGLFIMMGLVVLGLMIPRAVDKFAKDSDSRLGKIRTANQGRSL